MDRPEADLLGKIIRPKDEKEWEVLVDNVSTGGLRVFLSKVVSEVPSQGDRLEIEFDLDSAKDDTEKIQLKGQARHVEEQATVYILGIQIDGDQEDLQKLRILWAKLMLQGPE